ncbi:MAG: Type pilin N-term methylation site GFxxxE [Acidobacteria bacterium]|nr:Type pilin N-term methylation site GFxxxE [Acidobacteriota bacterium]
MIEAIIAIFILTTGLIGTAAAVTYALEFSAISRNVTKAKLVVVASIEEIESLRNSRRLEFKQFANTGNVNNEGSPNQFLGFSNGFKDVSNTPGTDGVNGTADDTASNPGADGVFGTADDVFDRGRIREGYKRQIEIIDLSGSLKKVVIKVRYMNVNGKLGEIVGVSYLNDETRTTL